MYRTPGKSYSWPTGKSDIATIPLHRWNVRAPAPGVTARRNNWGEDRPEHLGAVSTIDAADAGRRRSTVRVAGQPVGEQPEEQLGQTAGGGLMVSREWASHGSPC